MNGKVKGTAIKPQAFAWLDANASVLTRNQLYEQLASNFNLTLKTAKAYTSQWRSSNGVQRTYKRRTNKETTP